MFLECAEISVSALEALRTPLEDGEIRLARRDGVACYPARFQLVLAAVLKSGPFKLSHLVVVTAHGGVVVASGGAPVTVERQFRKTAGIQRPPGRSRGEGLASGQTPVGDEQTHPGGGKKVGLVGQPSLNFSRNSQ